MRAVLLPLLALLAARATAQDAPYGYPPVGYAQSGYDTDGQSVDSIEVFFEPLAHYGRWLDTRYGRAWAPNVPRDWRPYTIGHWEEGRYGLTWRSDEPFGWAVFHFGRWAFDPAVGWVWLPDTVWGPGWVAWRDSDDVTGWAPLPPQVSVGFAFGTGYGFNDWGYDQWYQPGWIYIPRGYLYSRSLRGAYLPAGRNREWWEHSRGITRYDRVDGQVVNRSFGHGEGDRRGDGDHREDGDRRGDGDRRRDGGRDPRRDGARADLRSAEPYGGAPAAASPYGYTPRGVVPPVRGAGRDGFVPGTPQPRGLARDGFVPMPAHGTDRRGFVPPAGLPVTRPAMPSAAMPVRPVMPAPQAMPAAPRPAPQPVQPRQAREPNPNERPR